MRRFLRENGLSVALFGFFLVFLAGQSIAGLKVHNDDAAAHGGRPSGYLSYLASGHFIEAVFENWESEFLQMAAFVVLTIFLRQKGSSESKPLDEEPEPKRPKPKPGSPWPVRRGGWIETVYQNSLTIALVLLFLLSFGLHALGGAAEANQERSEHGKPPIGRLEYLGTSRFWFESFQNWQSEFLAVGTLIVLSIFLRQKGSPQSKQVEEPHAKTSLTPRRVSSCRPRPRDPPEQAERAPMGARYARTRRIVEVTVRASGSYRPSRPLAPSRRASGRPALSSSRLSWWWSPASDTRARARRSPRSENQPG